MDLPTGLRNRLARAASKAAFYFLAGMAVSVLIAFVLSQTVDVRLATSLSAGDEQWSVQRWDRPGATQLLSIRHFWARWSPRQATGPPDTPVPGDCDTAWASAVPDAAGDWLELSYPNAVVPRSVKIYESYNPGAVCRVTAFKADGTEIDAWQGVDPTPTSAPSGTSDIPLQVPFAINRVRIYLASEKVPGWNEIDAAGLIGADGSLQWASDARASSYYGTSSAAGQPASSPAPADLIPAWSGLDHPGPAMRDRLAKDEYRLADARGWPMPALYSETAISASVAGAINGPGSSTSYIGSGFLGTTLSGSTPSALPTTPPDVAPVPLRPIWSGLTTDAAVFGGSLLLLRWLLTAPGRDHFVNCPACGTAAVSSAATTSGMISSEAAPNVAGDAVKVQRGIRMQEIRNQRVTVAGLGRFGGGIAVTRWLAGQGARVLVTDRDPPEKLAESVKQLDGTPVEFHLGGHRDQDFTDTDLVVASPAIPPHSPYLAAVRAAGVPVTTEIRLFVERCPATLLGVTGTKGKSTTTEMLGRMLRCRYQTWVGGNIGKSLLADLDRIEKTHMVVLELSSFMLDYLGEMQWSPHVALITLLSQDHLEWHGSYEAYADAKRNIVRFQRPDDVVAVNEECPPAIDLARASPGRMVRFGVEGRRPFDLAIPGRHNQLNAQGAFAAAAVLGVTWEQAAAAIRDFAGLPHRLQLVHEAAGVRYYNDSIATIPDAAVAALETFEPKRVIQIVGGKDKHIPFKSLCAALCERAKAAICIGDTGPALADCMAESSSQRGAAVYRCSDLATAVRVARSIAVPGDVVLLSTGYASYDQFANFEKRGEAFTKLVRGEA